jgi:hypothetical protein
MTCLGVTSGMCSTPTSALEVIFIKQEARQAANRLLGNACSYVPNFGHSEVLIGMTVGSKGQICDECVDLVAPDALIFFTDGSLCSLRKQSWCRRIL